MLFQLLRKKVSALGIPPLGLLLCIGVLSCILFFGKTSQTPAISTPKIEKSSGSWLKISQAGNFKFCEALAKKEQLEKDLITFHPIASAKVAFALPSETEIETPLRLSVILTLQKDQPLTPTLLFSITDYLCSSLPGLDKKNITLSDNFGNFYTPESININFLLFSSLENYLSKLFPKEHFALSCIPTKDKPILQLDVNETYLSCLSKENAARVWGHASHYLHQYYSNNYTVMTKQIPFAHKTKNSRDISKYFITGMILLSSLGIVALASLYLAWHAYERIESKPRKIKRGINITKLIEIIQKEPPQKIALILSYLDPKKAEELLNKLPEDIHHQVLKYKL
ncbi:type III secretion system protein [Chlamydia sp. 17-3921]|uniref:type III secretion system protein n=1 Tax=Chlamydia sp. 17-3921 TaxID=2675798 RepID=UPI00191AC00D|nr:type III secretion system protein [Chlamydia sp. 17-3921]